MELKDFTDLGSGIGRRVNDAVNDMNFDRLSSDIEEEINRFFGKEPEYGGLNGKLYREPPGGMGQEGMGPEKESFGQQQDRPFEAGFGSSGAGRTAENFRRDKRQTRGDFSSAKIPIAPKIPGKVSGILLMILGIALAAGCGVPAVICGVLGGTLSSVGTIAPGMFAAVSAGLAPLSAAGIIMAIAGRGKYKRRKRFGIYLETMGNAAFCSVKDLAAAVGKSPRFAAKDLARMIRHRFFLQGHLDDAKTCFIGTDEMYGQYLQARDSAAESAAESEERKAGCETPESGELEQVIRSGEAYIAAVRSANDAIYNEEISEKLYRMEVVLEKIFDYVRKNPEQVGQLRRFMSYYMPITEKLVKAYQDMDLQPIEGSNIKKAKAEIAQTLDTINDAFEKLYDGMYSQVAMDVSSDIAVLKTMFAQEGLAGKGIKGEKKK